MNWKEKYCYNCMYWSWVSSYFGTCGMQSISCIEAASKGKLPPLYSPIDEELTWTAKAKK